MTQKDLDEADKWLSARGYRTSRSEHRLRVSLPYIWAVKLDDGADGPRITAMFGRLERSTAIAVDFAVVAIGALLLSLLSADFGSLDSFFAPAFFFFFLLVILVDVMGCIATEAMVLRIEMFLLARRAA